MGGKAALIQVLGFGFIISMISSNLNTIATHAQGNMSQYAAATESHNLAVSGANIGLARFYQDTSWRGTVTQNLTGVLKGTLSYTIANHSSGRPYLRSVSACNHPDGVLRDTVEILFNPGGDNSFTLFAWMTNFEGNVFWYHRRHHLGPGPHERPAAYDRDARLHGQGYHVERAQSQVGNGRKPGDLQAGVRDRRRRDPLPYRSVPAVHRGHLRRAQLRRQHRRHARRRNCWPTMTGMRSSGREESSSTASRCRAAGSTAPSSRRARVSVKGTVDGRLTIGSGTQIYVTDNIQYENRAVATSDDVLGLVSNASVIVADNAANSSNCEVDASIFARSGSFSAENYSSGSPRGQLKVLGSIVQESRGSRRDVPERAEHAEDRFQQVLQVRRAARQFQLPPPVLPWLLYKVVHDRQLVGERADAEIQLIPRSEPPLPVGGI